MIPQIPKLSYLGYALAAIIIYASIGRWFFHYFVPYKALVGVALGLLVAVLSYFYTWMKRQEKELEKLSKRFQWIVSMWLGREKEDIRKMAEGGEIDG